VATRQSKGTAADRHAERIADLQEALTDSGIPVAPIYGPRDAGVDGDAPERIGYPGIPPYTRGIYPSMYRGRLWTMRIYSGWGGPEDTNERFRYLLERGQTGLSVALDLPTQMGMDSDDARALGEIGKVGVAIDSLADMETIFDGIPLDRVSTSFTINATAPILLAMYIAVAGRQGVPAAEVRGTVQNDILKEYLARKTYIYPPEPSLRLVTDVLEWAATEAPKFNPISVCGYHMRQAGCDAVQEIAYTLGNARTYLDAVVGRGVPVDRIAPRFSFNFSTMRDFFEEIAKHRAARRMWARIVQERFGAEDERSLQLRLFSGGDGTSLTAVEPHNNIVRIAYQALAIVLSGAQAVHTISWDEALGLPNDDAVLIALRTQQILAYETGVTRTADPLGGSWYLESLTDEIERRATELLDEIDASGGTLEGVIDGTIETSIADAAYQRQLAEERGDTVVVGQNAFVDEDASAAPPAVFTVPPTVEARQLERLAALRAQRDGAAVAAALARLRAEAAGTANLMPAIQAAVEAYATVGEISDAMLDVFGRHRVSTIV
jgi:methylmalonyl-CoA mutase N-terminal domain/subunit